MFYLMLREMPGLSRYYVPNAYGDADAAVLNIEDETGAVGPRVPQSRKESKTLMWNKLAVGCSMVPHTIGQRAL